MLDEETAPSLGSHRHLLSLLHQVTAFPSGPHGLERPGLQPVSLFTSVGTLPPPEKRPGDRASSVLRCIQECVKLAHPGTTEL